MKKTIISIIMMVIMLCSTMLVAGVGEYAGEATYDPDMDVGGRDAYFWESWFIGSQDDTLEIGAYKSNGLFSTNFYTGETATLKFDETTWNVQCGSAKFVVEIYSPSGFKEARYYWLGPVSGNKHFKGQLNYPLSAQSGTWSFVDYVYCVDPASSMNLELISKASKIEVSVTEQGSEDTCDKGYTGRPFCGDGDVKQNYRNSDCSFDLKLIEACDSPNYCFSGECHKPECSKDGDCESWQECKKNECVTTEDSINNDKGSGDDNTGDERADEGSGTEDDEDDSDDDDGETKLNIGLIMGLVLLVLGIIAAIFLPILGVGMFVIGLIMTGVQVYMMVGK
ncbi:hypothetical protein D1BOALGB6SA_4981 [Olavius sp. associated proteobacterium Delta 1]|nr:hypothetical protein D1BOALGB6SA_4981 [Olavius sp. associated proteobacterium Delta 1]